MLNLPFFTDKQLYNVFKEDFPQGFLGFKLLVECMPVHVSKSVCFFWKKIYKGEHSYYIWKEPKEWPRN